jgi:hypothetical protein
MVPVGGTHHPPPDFAAIACRPRSSDRTCATFRREPTMAPTGPCTRHSARIWMAYCAPCAAWHVARAIALRDGSSAGSADGRFAKSAAAQRQPDSPASPVRRAA